MTTAFWNERYAAQSLAYGSAPNDFLAHMADRLPASGYALDIGAGEGRNALYLAARGLDVLAVDQSDVGLAKARDLAGQRNLPLRTLAVDLADFKAAPATFDVITSIFVHLPAQLRAQVHAGVRTWLKPGGVFLLEAYAPEQFNKPTGGPRDISRLASVEEIVADLEGLAIEHHAALVRTVTEGTFHSGEAHVVQVLARKT